MPGILARKPAADLPRGCKVWAAQLLEKFYEPLFDADEQPLLFRVGGNPPVLDPQDPNKRESWSCGGGRLLVNIATVAQHPEGSGGSSVEVKFDHAPGMMGCLLNREHIVPVSPALTKQLGAVQNRDVRGVGLLKSVA